MLKKELVLDNEFKFKKIINHIKYLFYLIIFNDYYKELLLLKIKLNIF